jgi:hypothetical protein
MNAEAKKGDITVNFDELPVFASVDLPVLVRSEETAISLLGGLEVIQNAIQTKATYLELDFPNVDPLRQKLVGQIGKCASIVMKVSRNKRKPNDATKFEIVGKTTHAYAFSNPVDYQVSAYEELNIHTALI